MEKSKLEETLDLDIQFAKRGGLIPVVAQDFNSGLVLMLAYANKEAVEETLRSKYATFWSTSRNELWTKGKTSGDLMEVKEILIDCDQDALVYRVIPIKGGACHTKSDGEHRKSCFYRKIDLNEDSGNNVKFVE